ncbi:Flp family type IVb pilin [Sneathiella limimaris]|uniref:Flp family type IVb pilin n=1 Tax=Sneathiella limimaris TaxID=1964213 RepID=UPI00146C8898|nr:Flp family type IVb pilin [Sneathiella limimaris]
MSSLLKFVQNESGATAIEYGLIASLVAVAGIVAFTTTGGTISSSFAEIAKDVCEVVGGEFTLSDTGEDSCSFS